MKINVANLGVIKRFEIDLSKSINVFCGPNGTGKTYMAYAIYGLLNSYVHISSNRDIARKLVENKEVRFDIDYQLLFKYRSEMMEHCKNDLDALFGIGPSDAEYYFKDTVIEFVENEELFKSVINKSFIDHFISFNKVEVNVSKKENSDSLTLKLVDEVIASKNVDLLEFALSRAIYHLLAVYPTNSVHILPVERNSIYTFSKELSIRKQEAIDHFHAMRGKERISELELFFDKSNRYPKPIKDGLVIAEDLVEVKKNKSAFYDFALNIEKDLLQGQVNISSEGQIQFVPERAPKKNLPIHMSASIVKTLSSLVLYLKHIALKNDLIIIDEPEINLHPDSQIVLTKLFSRLANNGFRLLISTHSDYIIREINNLVMLSSEEGKAVNIEQKLGYLDDEYIEEKNIEVHYFAFSNNERKKQVQVTPVKLSRFGFDIKSIGETIDNQNKVSEELFYALNSLKNE